jgi:hypothetical protein
MEVISIKNGGSLTPQAIAERKRAGHVTESGVAYGYSQTTYDLHVHEATAHEIQAAIHELATYFGGTRFLLVWNVAEPPQGMVFYHGRRGELLGYFPTR